MTTPQESRTNSSDKDCPDLCLTLWLYVSPQETLPVQARFHYDPAMPFAVSVDFSNTAGGAVTWVLSRELLSEGLLRPSGEGDVHIWPRCPRYGGRRSLHIQLVGRSGIALLYADLTRVRSWIADTYVLVPSDSEGEAIDWEASFARVLRGGTDEARGGAR
ncbi:SsgA family sporulation/cell division regulator [Streptomyces sp. NBC_01136]|uniref:SsgA family sporulation/cell division regulator n=1 Tax=unclassified Streptomyces TaxID=2593676 RepID=UPI003250821B|nr:SsgA family sporulation/cell division regulator [Streptomyces sp. NBC_01136]